MTKLEEVARRLAKVAAERATEVDPTVFSRHWDSVDYYVSQNWTKYEREARAAIEALRVPNEAMVLAACAQANVEQARPVAIRRTDVAIVFDAAINAALVEKPE